MNIEYTLLLGGSYLVPGIYIIIHRRFLKRDYGLLPLNLTTFVAAVPFIIWDIYATALGHWQFNPQVTLPIKIAGLPIEELLFFILIPQSCLLVWVALKRYSSGHSIKTDVMQHFHRQLV